MQLEDVVSNGERVFIDVLFRDVFVEDIQHIGEQFIRIVFSGESLSNFVSPNFDDHVKLVFDEINGETIMRNYTPRYFSHITNRLTIDFEKHSGGVASNWACNTKLGDSLIVAGPRSSITTDNSYAHQILIGDNTALPAIVRRIEESASIVKTHVYLLNGCTEYLTNHLTAKVDVFNFDSVHKLVIALQAQQTMMRDGLVWAAGEGSMIKIVRKCIKQSAQFNKYDQRFSVYWQKGEVAAHQELS